MKSRFKKIVALEFIILLGSTILFGIIYSGWHLLHNRSKGNLYNLNSTIQSRQLPINYQIDIGRLRKDRKKFHFFYENGFEIGFLTESFKEFDSKKDDINWQNELFEITSSSELYTKSKSEFLLKYFPFSQQADEIESPYINQNPYKGLEKDFRNRLLKEIDWNSSDDALQKTINQEMLADNETYQEFVRETSKLQEKRRDLKLSIFQKPITKENIIWLGIILFSITFGLRYLYYCTVWSIKQLKN